MKNCEYFERLISMSIDEPLTSEQQKDLNEHLRGCRGCRSFKESAEHHRALLNDMPRPVLSRKLSIPAPEKSRKNRLKSLWDSQITIPVPLAAAFLVIIVAATLFNLLQDSKSLSSKPPVPACEIKFVQEIKLKPVTAQIIDDFNRDNE